MEGCHEAKTKVIVDIQYSNYLSNMSRSLLRKGTEGSVSKQHSDPARLSFPPLPLVWFGATHKSC
jgi:hypothetical protein